SDALYDRHLPLVVQRFHPPHRLLPAEMRVDFEDVFLPDSDRRAMLVVHRVAVRHDRVQAVVAAEPLEDHQDLARARRRRHLAGPAEDVRDRTDATAETKPQAAGADADHFAAPDAAVVQLTAASHDVRLSPSWVR